MTMREKMARAICAREGVDPDARAHGTGRIMPKDAEYALWEARLPVVGACLDALTEPTGEMLDAIKGVASSSCGPTTKVPINFVDACAAWLLMIQAAKDGK